MTFRSILGPEIIVGSLANIIKYLQAQSVVVHSYAASALDKILTIRTADKQQLVTAAHLTPVASDLFIGLFNVLSQPGSTENEFAMKTIMRSFSTLQEASLPYMGQALPRLTEILTEVAKNPSKPHFNHYLFETFSVSITIICNNNLEAVNAFEAALFPVFQGILQQDVLEFMPYVFQILSLLLEVREGKSEVPEPYLALFPCLLAPPLWERPGNVTPLIRLLCAFVKQASPKIQADGKLNAVLGVFQKMLSSRANDHEGFNLLQTLVEHYPRQELLDSMVAVFRLMFQRLSNSKTTKYVKCFIVFVSFFGAKVGVQQLIQMIDSIQPKLFGMVIERIFILEMNKLSSNMDRKVACVGTTLILTEAPQMFTDYAHLWAPLLQSLIQVFELPPEESNEDEKLFDIEDAAGYEVAYSQLSHAQQKKVDLIPEVSDIRKFLIENLLNLAQRGTCQLNQLVANLPIQHKEAMQKYCVQFGAPNLLGLSQ